MTLRLCPEATTELAAVINREFEGSALIRPRLWEGSPLTQK